VVACIYKDSGTAAVNVSGTVKYTLRLMNETKGFFIFEDCIIQ